MKKGVRDNILIVFVLLFLVPSCAAVRNTSLTETGLSFPCAAGDVTPDTAVLWFRPEGEGSIAAQFGKEVSLREFTTTTAVKVTKETDFTTKIWIGDLEANTTYYYRGAVVGKKPGPICRFVTAPQPDDLANVKFAFGADTKQMLQPFTIMDSILAMEPDFFLFLGDTIYADREGVASRLPQFWAKYAANRNDLPTQRLFSETSLYVTWDDHEVRDDYDSKDPLAPIGQRAFFDYWPIRQDPEYPNRLYRSFRWGKAVELFILDTRQYRDLTARTMLGREQKQWLLRSLSSSTALFKFIVTSVPCSSPRRDKWGDFPEEREEILNFISGKQIKGVIILAGDAHYAGVCRIPVARGLELTEIIVGPLASSLNKKVRGTAERFEFFSNDSFNYGMVKVYAKAKEPYAEIDILDEANYLLYRKRIHATGVGWAVSWPSPDPP